MDEAVSALLIQDDRPTIEVQPRSIEVTTEGVVIDDPNAGEIVALVLVVIGVLALAWVWLKRAE